MSTAHQILKIALPVPLRREYDYLPPLAPNHTPQPGVRVRVPFGNREFIGVVVAIADSSSLAIQKLKHASEILDAAPIISSSLLKLCQWCATYYHHPLGEVLTAALPGEIRLGKNLRASTDNYYQLTSSFSDADREALKRAPKQTEIINLVMQHELGASEHALKALGLTGSPLKALLDRGWIKLERIDVAPAPPSAQNLSEAPLTLNSEQTDALAKIEQSMDAYSCLLLAGITGSGKTEVYLQAIDLALSKGKTALVLVPEISLTPQTVARFRQRFRCDVAVLHSGLTQKERARTWFAAANGETRIVIGTRSSVFAPLPDLGIIIVDEEHDLSFKQQDGMRYSARDVAVVRAQQAGIPVVLGSATPSIESLHNVATGRYQVARLTMRAGAAVLPAVHLIDIRSRPLQEGLSQPLIQAISEQITAGNQVLVFLNRRGFAPTLMCHACGWIADCENCDARLTLHKNPSQMQCHHCGYKSPIPLACGACGAQELHPIGLGTERSEEGLASLFQNTPVIRIDRDTTRNQNTLQSQLDMVNSGTPCILVGTQMLAKGHHFPDVTLVAILDADGGLFSADFRGIERMAQLIDQVGGRAGRAEKPGTVLIQTHQPEHPHIKALVERGYSELSEQLMRERSESHLPPYQHWIILRAEAVEEDKPRHLLGFAKNHLAEYLSVNPDAAIDCFGPLPALIYRRKNRFRLLQVFQSDNRAPLHQFMQSLMPLLESTPMARRVRWSIDIDPQECF